MLCRARRDHRRSETLPSPARQRGRRWPAGRMRALSTGTTRGQRPSSPLSGTFSRRVATGEGDNHQRRLLRRAEHGGPETQKARLSCLRELPAPFPSPARQRGRRWPAGRMRALSAGTTRGERPSSPLRGPSPIALRREKGTIIKDAYSAAQHMVAQRPKRPGFFVCASCLPRSLLPRGSVGEGGRQAG